MFWHSDDEEVEWQAREGNANADKRVDGIAIKWHGHQEDGAEAEDNGEEKAELEGRENRWRLGSYSNSFFCEDENTDPFQPLHLHTQLPPSPRQR